MAQFTQTYGGSPERQAFIQRLEQELRAIQARGWGFSAFVYGSLVNDLGKPAPGDIDVLLCIAQLLGATPWTQITPKAEVQIKYAGVTGRVVPGQPALMAAPLCLTLQEMVEQFNAEPNNLAKGIAITISECVDVTL